jgi:hypothetical protein
MTKLEMLNAELKGFCAGAGLPQDACANELLCSGVANEAHRLWLEDFVERWKRVQFQEDLRFSDVTRGICKLIEVYGGDLYDKSDGQLPDLIVEKVDEDIGYLIVEAAPKRFFEVHIREL